MIVFDLSCDNGHRFEGWFGSSADFQSQSADGLVTCPNCGSAKVSKMLTAPAVQTKGNRQPASTAAGPEKPETMTAGELPAEVVKAMEALAKAQTEALKHSTWVGENFAETSRAMHYGDRQETAIHGKATPEEAKGLRDEGIEIAPLPFPVSAPEDLN